MVLGNCYVFLISRWSFQWCPEWSWFLIGLYDFESYSWYRKDLTRVYKLKSFQSELMIHIIKKKWFPNEPVKSVNTQDLP